MGSLRSLLKGRSRDFGYEICKYGRYQWICLEWATVPETTRDEAERKARRLLPKSEGHYKKIQSIQEKYNDATVYRWDGTYWDMCWTQDRKHLLRVVDLKKEICESWEV